MSTPDNNTPDPSPPSPPVSPWRVEGLNTTTRMALAMRELAVFLPVEFPDRTPAPTPEVPFPSSEGIIGVHIASFEVSVQVSATMLVDAAMTGKVVCVETNEVHHHGPDKPATLHYMAWFPNLLPESKLRVKVTACETLAAVPSPDPQFRLLTRSSVS